MEPDPMPSVPANIVQAMEVLVDRVAVGRGIADARIALKSAIAELAAERDRYRDALVARHGGEPLALLSELDAARAERDRAVAERDALSALRQRPKDNVRCRAIAQTIIAAIGSNGPEDAEESVARALAELAATKAKLAGLLDASKAGSELVEDLYGYAITDWAWKYGPEWLAQRDAFRSAIAAAEQGGA